MRLSLDRAVVSIAKDNFMLPQSLLSIEYEDGSGLKFNYKLASGNYYAEFNVAGSVIRNTFRQ